MSTQEMGLIDFDAHVSKASDAVAYAFTEFTSDRERDVEIRIGCYTAFKLWVNGKLTLVRSDAFTGMVFRSLPGARRSERSENTLLMKVSRAAPPAGVPNLWRFQSRVCDGRGVAILSTTRPAVPSSDKKS